MAAAPDDWRRMGQERFLPSGTTFARRAYRPYSDSWDHDHCEFCDVKFTAADVGTREDVLTEGYATTDDHAHGAEYHWVCDRCFRDFADEFGWRETPG